MIIKVINKVVTGFIFASLLVGVVAPFSVQPLQAKFSLAGLFSAENKEKKDYTSVIDTISGLNTYYNLSNKIDKARVKLVLADENKKLTVLDKVKDSGSIDSMLIKDTGLYTLYTAYKTDSGKYKVIEKDTFKVSKPVAGMDLKAMNVFLQSEKYGVGGDLVAQANTDRFKFEDVPTSVGLFDNFTLSVKALNGSGDLNSNYTGTIVFETDDANAQLPEEYTFISADAGLKKFEDAFYLSEVGTTEVRVKDKSTSDLIGKVNIVVTASTEPATSGGVMQVSSPTAGVVVQNTVLFSGTVDAGLEVQILDKGIILGTTNADGTGKFSYTSPVLPDGEHEFVLKTNNATSSVIAVTISSGSLNVSSVLLSPLKPVSGQEVEITVNLNSAASAVSVVMNGIKTDLVSIDSLKKIYRGKLVAPTEPNSYPVNLDITSDLGIRSEVQSASTLEVLLGSAEDENSLDGGITFNVPSQVLGIQALPQDKRVTLNWQPATDDTGISFYRVFYGTDISDLSVSVDTNEPTTSWFIPDLETGVRYFFQVYGVDTEGNQGDQGSIIISAIPGVEGSTTLHGTADGQVLVNATAETGPEIFFILIFSMGVAYLIRRKQLAA